MRTKVNDQHKKAQELSVKAAALLASGRTKEARDIFAEAAGYEAEALGSIAADKAKTRSVLTLSHASLLYKADLLKEAERSIFSYLSTGNITVWAETQLRELLNVVTDEYLLKTSRGRRYSGENITVSLRGGEIGAGTGPFDLVLDKAAGFRSLLYRIAEWVGDFPLRYHGPPPRELSDLVQARVTEPTVGSYTLEIRLTEPAQQKLFESPRIPPAEVSERLFAFLECLTSGTPEELNKVVPNLDYRRALLQLTRNIAPGGKRIREIGIYRKKHDQLQSVYLTNELPPRIREALPKEKISAEEQWTDQGILRALNLDRNWLILAKDDGTHARHSTKPELLDDVVGPMVNRRVMVSGLLKQRGTKKYQIVSEIELTDAE